MSFGGVRIGSNHVPTHTRVAWGTATPDPEYIWQDDAACAFTDPLTFEPALMDSERARGMSEDERTSLNESNFKKAAALCARCPVLETCEAEATSADFEWTFRAGKLPKSYRPAKRGRPRKSEVKTFGPDLGVCRYGHKGMYKVTHGTKRECTECLRLKSAKRRREGGVKTRAQHLKEVTTSTVCRNGHVGKFKFYGKKKVRRCSECINNFEKGKRQRKGIRTREEYLKDVRNGVVFG